MGRGAAGGQGRTGAFRRTLIAAVAIEILILVVAVTLSAIVGRDGDPLPGDLRLVRWAQDLPAFHTIARGFRWGTGTEGVLLIGGASVVALWFGRRPREALALFAALAVLRTLQPLIKNVVDRPRPPEDLVDRRAGFNSESFPSGHMMSTFVLCAMLAVIAWRLPLPRWGQVAATGVLVVMVVLNGTSSLYMGVHWPSDVLGGALWGAGIALPAGVGVVWWRSAPRA